MTVSTPRGIRNNNPGNIRRTQIAWRGEVPGADKDFETFSTPEYGIRAMGKLLQNYADEGINTITKIINRYAPTNENDTGAYVRAVALHTGFEPDQPLNLREAPILHALVVAIIIHENGTNPYSETTINRALSMLT